MAAKGSRSQTALIDTLVIGFIKHLWNFRVELLLLVTALFSYSTLKEAVGKSAAALSVGLIISGLLVVKPTRNRLLAWLYIARVRRRWIRALKDTVLESSTGDLPIVCKSERILAGDRLVVQVSRGSSVPELEKRAEIIAAAFGVREVQITRNANNAAFAEVILVKHDRVESPEILKWPLQTNDRVSLWDPIPVGIDSTGRTVGISLPERNVLLGGEPGAGKSASISMLIATAALDPTVKLWLFDGKMVELAAWARISERNVGIDINEALEVLYLLKQEMEKRYRDLLERGLRKVSPEDGLPLHVVVCDELAFYLTVSDKKQRTEFSDLMRDLVSRGRAAGIIVIAATQKPSHDIIPTSLRDLFGFRWALRCNTPQASDTILGGGWSTLGYSAAEISANRRGVGYLLAEERQPVKVKACYLTDNEIKEIADRALNLRSEMEVSQS